MSSLERMLWLFIILLEFYGLSLMIRAIHKEVTGVCTGTGLKTMLHGLFLLLLGFVFGIILTIAG